MAMVYKLAARLSKYGMMISFVWPGIITVWQVKTEARRNNNRELADDVEGRKCPLLWPFEVAAMSLDVFFIVFRFVVMLEIVFNIDIVLELAFNEIKSTVGPNQAVLMIVSPTTLWFMALENL